MSKICSSCNTENVDEAKFCRKCGNQNFTLQNELAKVKTEKIYIEKIEEGLSPQEKVFLEKCNLDVKSKFVKVTPAFIDISEAGKRIRFDRGYYTSTKGQLTRTYANGEILVTYRTEDALRQRKSKFRIEQNTINNQTNKDITGLVVIFAIILLIYILNEFFGK